MPIRVAIGKFVIGMIQIGSGASLGRGGDAGAVPNEAGRDDVLV
jgi:hypothetical protein